MNFSFLKKLINLTVRFKVLFYFSLDKCFSVEWPLGSPFCNSAPWKWPTLLQDIIRSLVDQVSMGWHMLSMSSTEENRYVTHHISMSKSLSHPYRGRSRIEDNIYICCRHRVSLSGSACHRLLVWTSLIILIIALQPWDYSPFNSATFFRLQDETGKRMEMYDEKNACVHK